MPLSSNGLGQVLILKMNWGLSSFTTLKDFVKFKYFSLEFYFGAIWDCGFGKEIIYVYVCRGIHYLHVLCTYVHYLSICMHCLCVCMHMCALFMCLCAYLYGVRCWCQVTSLISFHLICWLRAYCWMQRPSSCVIWLAGLHWGRSWERENLTLSASVSWALIL